MGYEVTGRPSTAGYLELRRLTLEGPSRLGVNVSDRCSRRKRFMSGYLTKIWKRMVVTLLLVSPACLAQGRAIEAGARKGIDAGNQAWIDGMKQGTTAPIAATYSKDAVDCGSTGDCVHGRAAIEQHIKEQIERLGRAQSAAVSSKGAVQQKEFVYEWGRAVASFANGKRVVDEYLTVWQRQPDGNWKIFRNMVIPSAE